MEREIKPELVIAINEKLSDPNLYLAYLALACVGEKESGVNSGPFIKLLQETVGEAAGEAWCLSFVQSLVAFVEKTDNLKSPLAATESCLDLWTQSKTTQQMIVPVPGSLIVWRHGASAQGHVGIIIADYGSYFMTVEGNTGNGSGIIREGDGIYLKMRSKERVGDMIQLGFLRAF